LVKTALKAALESLWEEKRNDRRDSADRQERHPDAFEAGDCRQSSPSRDVPFEDDSAEAPLAQEPRQDEKEPGAGDRAPGLVPVREREGAEKGSEFPTSDDSAEASSPALWSCPGKSVNSRCEGREGIEQLRADALGLLAEVALGEVSVKKSVGSRFRWS